MNCVVLAGGRGIRLSPLTDCVPKPMINFKNKPLIDYVVEILYPRFEQIIIVVDYLGFIIQKHFQNSLFSDKLLFVYQRPDIRGTMGALLSVKDYIDSDFLVICSDNLYSPVDLDRLLLQKNSFLVKSVTSIVKDMQYRDAKFSLFKRSGFIYLEAGAWYLEKDFLLNEPILVEGSNEFGIPHTIFSDFILNNKKYRTVFASFWFPVGTKWELDYVNKNVKPP
jgi:NDP-sugar pyrophosphorylase family protein